MSSASPEVFPVRLREARGLRQLSQGELAQKTGLQPSAVSHFETGARKPSFDNLRRLADALKVTTDYLLGRVDTIEALAGPDQLHRDYSQLSSADREVADQMMALLAAKAKKAAQ